MTPLDTHACVHGYSDDEHDRLLEQASTLSDLLHCDTRYSDKLPYLPLSPHAQRTIDCLITLQAR